MTGIPSEGAGRVYARKTLKDSSIGSLCSCGQHCQLHAVMGRVWQGDRVCAHVNGLPVMSDRGFNPTSHTAHAPPDNRITRRKLTETVLGEAGREERDHSGDFSRLVGGRAWRLCGWHRN